MSNSALRLMSSSPCTRLIRAASLAFLACFTACHLAWKAGSLANARRPASLSVSLILEGRE